MKCIFLLCGLLSFASCAHQPEAKPETKSETKPIQAVASERAPEDNLREDLASFRAAQVRSVSYELTITLAKGSPDYSVKTVIHTELNQMDRALSLDLVAGKVEAVRVNGAAISDFVLRVGSLDIPAKYLLEKSVIEVTTRSTFAVHGEGFLRSVDPEDHAEYMYTDFEPYYAHTVFPCFDQPDLKAKFKISVDAPAEWKTISNESVETLTADASHVVTHFRETAPISPYLVFFGAGPFVEWNDKADNVPLVLYARKSLAKYVDAKRIFATTKKGLKFFGEYFGKLYPFSKFGQVFVPEFTWGGMENPGAIALSERNIHRGKVTESTQSNTDSLILHEMAHMWFGDFVTMKWWNDVWLNESFAEYVAALAMDRALGKPTYWLEFTSTKAWAYWQDQLVTTHPIEGRVDDTRTVKGNFDGITYGKGAAALKQLHYFVGDQAFRDGLRSYFQRYGFKNTVRESFTSAIASAAHQDLDTWTRDWLQTAGPNRVKAHWACEGGKLNKFVIEQLPSSSNTLATHRTQVGLFKADDKGKLEMFKAQDVLFSAAQTPVDSFNGVACPDFVYANVGDYDYALYSIDPASFKHAGKALTGGIADPTLRYMVFASLFQMVRDTEVASTEALQMALTALAVERDPTIIDRLLGAHSTLKGLYFGFLTPQQRNTFAPQFEKILLARGGELAFFDFYLAVAHTPTALGRLKNFIDGEMLPKGIAMDQDRRWQALSTLARENYPGILRMIDAEEKKDKSTAGQRAAYTARVAIPGLQSREKFWREVAEPGKLPITTQVEAANAFNLPDHPEISAKFTQAYFERVTKLDWSANDLLTGLYLEQLFPSTICTEELLVQSQQHLSEAKRLTSLARRKWLEANDGLAKCIAVRRRANQGVSG